MSLLRDDVLAETKLGEEEKEALDELFSALKNLPDLEIRSVVLYGSAVSDAYRPGRSDVNLLFLVNRLDLAVLRELVGPVARGRRGSLAPLFLTEEDVKATVDAFPLKYMAIGNRHRILYGIDFLAELTVDMEHVLLRVRQRLMNMLMRMRRHYLVAGGQHLTAVMARESKRFVETLGILLSLRGLPLDKEGAIIDASARAYNLSPEVLHRLYDLRDADGALEREEEEELYDRFLEALRTVAESLVFHQKNRE